MGRGEDIDQIRQFNRTYLPVMHLMDANYLGTGRSITDARVLFEIHDHPDCTARDLCERLRLDKGYLSRILARLEADGLVSRASAPDDGRARLVRLTARGRRHVDALVEGGRGLVASTLGDMSDAQVAELAGHMRAILVALGYAR